MNNKNVISLLIITFKRNINTSVLQDLMEKMSQHKTLQNTKNVKNEDFLEKINKLKEKVEMKSDNKSYETIQENLNESLTIMKELNSNFKTIKEKSLNINIKVENEGEILQKNKLFRFYA